MEYRFRALKIKDVQSTKLNKQTHFKRRHFGGYLHTQEDITAEIAKISLQENVDNPNTWDLKQLSLSSH